MQGTVCPDGKIRAWRTKDARVQAQEIVACARGGNGEIKPQASLREMVAQGKERL